MADPKWQTKTLSVALPPELQQLLDVYDEIADSINNILDISVDALNVISFLLTDIVNPLILALIFIAQQMLSLIQNLNATAVHIIGMYPSEATNSHFIRYKDVLPGFSDTSTGGFHVLNTDDLFRKYVDTFTDQGDTNRPPEGDNIVAGGLVIFAGAGTKEQIKTAAALRRTFELFQNLANFYADLLNVEEFKKFAGVLNKFIDNIDKAQTAADASTTISDTETKKSIAPDWKSRRVTKHIIPALGNALNSVEGIIQGFIDQAVGASTAVQNLIDYIEGKVKEIIEIQAELQDLRDFFNSLDLATLDLVTLNILVVEPQVGGINILKSSVLDVNLVGRPDRDLQFTALVSFVGAGSGVSLLLFLLGLTDSFELGVDDRIEFDEDSVRNAFGLPIPNSSTP